MIFMMYVTFYDTSNDHTNQVNKIPKKIKFAFFFAINVG